MVEKSPVDFLLNECREMADRAKVASRGLAIAPGSAKDGWLRRSALAIRSRSSEILAANAQDVAAGPGFGLNSAAIDRLTLDPKRLEAIASGLDEVAGLPDPVGEVIASSRRPNGLEVSQIRVPLGVIFMIFESRPNVTVDAASLCVKSGNAAILRGGKEAIHSNRALHQVLADELAPSGLPPDSVQLVATTDRAAVGHLLGMPDRVDLAIPRGGESLIRRVVAEAKMPVFEALHRELPRLCRRRRRSDDVREGRRQRQGPATGGLQRRRDLARPPRRPPGRSSRSSPRPSGLAVSNSVETMRPATFSRGSRPPSPPTGTPNTWI